MGFWIGFGVGVWVGAGMLALAVMVIARTKAVHDAIDEVTTWKSNGTR